MALALHSFHIPFGSHPQNIYCGLALLIKFNPELEDLCGARLGADQGRDGGFARTEVESV